MQFRASPACGEAALTLTTPWITSAKAIFLTGTLARRRSAT
jgi:hypothetical protein